MDRLGLCLAIYCLLVFLFFIILHEYEVGPYVVVLTFTWLMMILILMLCKELQHICEPTPQEPKPLRIVIVRDYKSTENATQNGRETTSRETKNIQRNDGRNNEVKAQEG